MAGYTDGQATRFNLDDDLLVGEALHLVETITVILDTSARDPANTPTTTLRKGLALGLMDSGYYKEFDDQATDGSEDDENVVILAHDVEDVDGNNRIAAAYYKATLKSTGIKVSSGSNAAPNWADVQRISLR